MSKVIDVNDPDSWSDDDVIYLRDRGQLPAGYELRSDLRIQPPAGPNLDEAPYAGDVNTYLGPTAGAEKDDGPMGVFMEEEDYDSMSKAQLQAEARARNLDDSGTKAELVSRLQSDMTSE